MALPPHLADFQHVEGERTFSKGELVSIGSLSLSGEVVVVFENICEVRIGGTDIVVRLPIPLLTPSTTTRSSKAAGSNKAKKEKKTKSDLFGGDPFGNSNPFGGIDAFFQEFTAVRGGSSTSNDVVLQAAENIETRKNDSSLQPVAADVSSSVNNAAISNDDLNHPVGNDILNNPTNNSPPNNNCPPNNHLCDGANNGPTNNPISVNVNIQDNPIAGGMNHATGSSVNINVSGNASSIPQFRAMSSFGQSLYAEAMEAQEQLIVSQNRDDDTASRDFEEVLQKSRREHVWLQLPRTGFTEHSDVKECPMCLVEFEAQDSIVRLPCLHAFHDSCVEEWVKRRGTCPTCLLDICANA